MMTKKTLLVCALGGLGLFAFACGKSGSTADDGNPSGAGANSGGSGGSTSAGGTGNTTGGAPSAGTGGVAGVAGTVSTGGVGGSAGASATGVDVLTRSYDAQRSGSNLKESVLTTKNVNKDQFGKLFELPVDDQVYAQILYVSKLTVAGGTHNVIYVATANNTVYAFDADVKGAPLWMRNFNGPNHPTSNADVGSACVPYRDFSGNIGIVSTPVIDRTAQTMYLVTRTVEGAATVHHLRSIDLTTGADKGVGSVAISATVDGDGTGSVNGKLVFDPVVQNQRMSLSLSNGVVYAGWSGFCDTGNYHGWVMGYDAATLTQTGVLVTTPKQSGTQTGWAGGVWQAGAAPVFDAQGNLYVVTGNGDYDGIDDFGQSALKLSARTLKVLDHFAPSNWDALNSTDWDLGSAGPGLIPGTNDIVFGGKEGKAYVVDTTNMGKFVTGDTQIKQSFTLVDPTARPTATHHLHDTVVFWEGKNGLTMYASGENDYLRAWRFDRTSGKFVTPQVAVAAELPSLGMPGGILSVSANGMNEGIVWVTLPRAGDANENVTPGLFRAYDADTLKLLWDSSSSVDDIHEFAKFNNPTVSGGKAYVASFSGVVSVFGLRPSVPVTPPVDLALSKPVTGSAPCAATEGPEKAVDGLIYAQDPAIDKFKWCSPTANAYLQIDLGAAVSVAKIVVYHAGAGGESIDLNSKAFELQVSTDGTNFTPVATVATNQASITTHTFPPTQARFVKLVVSAPTQNGNTATRIYEVEVFGP